MATRLHLHAEHPSSTPYVVRLFARLLDDNGVPRGTGEEVTVTLDSKPDEDITEGCRVRLVLPRVSRWQCTFNTGAISSGERWRATTIKPLRR